MIVFTCGGTGGHISPAINLARNLQEEVLFIGGNRLEKEMLKGIYPFKEITVSRNNLLLIIKGLFQAIKILKETKPRFVFSTGGYVSFPVSLATVFLGIPLVLLEQNSVPGKVNKVLAFFATLIFTGFPKAQEFFPKNKTVYSGNPVPINTSSSIKARKLLLVVGGSQGARNMNNLVFDTLPYLSSLGLKVFWITGNKNFEEITNKMKPFQVAEGLYEVNGTVVDIKAFLNKVTDYMPEVKLAISRAGAMSIAELVAYEIPAVYIPYEYAAENHQFYNAEYVVKARGGVMLEESTGDGGKLFEMLGFLNSNYDAYKDELRKLGKINSVRIIIDKLKKERLLE